MAKQTTVRHPDGLSDAAQTVARAKRTSLNQLIVEALEKEILSARKDKKFMEEARRLVKRDKEILDRLAK